MALPHVGHVPSLPGHTNTGEKYISYTLHSPTHTGASEYKAGTYATNRGSRVPWRSFPFTLEGFLDAIAYRDAALAGLPVPDRIRVKALLTREEIDAQTFEALRQKIRFLGPEYQHHERDVNRARRGEIMVANYLRETWNATVTDITDVNDKERWGCDLIATMPDGELRFVEVKTGGLKLTASQYARAVAEGDHYYLVKANPDTESVEFSQNPVKLRHITAITEYHVGRTK